MKVKEKSEKVNLMLNIQKTNESFPSLVDKKSRGPQGKRSGILKEEERTNFLLFSSTFLKII